MKKKPHPQEVFDRKRQATLQFMTAAEKKIWEEWYRGDGGTYFSHHLMGCGHNWWKTKKGLKWRRVAEERLKHWPKNNERFVK